jgi:glyoxylate reductase
MPDHGYAHRAGYGLEAGDELAMKTSRPVVLVARRLPAVGRERLATELEVIDGGLDVTAARVRELAHGAAAIVVDPAVAVGDQLLEAAGPALRIVANFGVGLDHVDLDACRRRGVFVTNTPDVLTDATAELALALTLAAARRLTAAAAALRDGRWTSLDPGAHLGLELSGSCVGIVGMGRIGYRYAELVRPLAGEIVYTSRRPSVVAERRLGAARLELGALLSRADVVSLHLPATPGDEPTIGRRELARMKPTTILVNTARGSLVDAAALAQALRAGSVAAAGLDVYENEPQVPRELIEAPNCVLLPHIGSATVRARDAMARMVADDVLAALGGDEPPNRVA